MTIREFFDISGLPVKEWRLLSERGTFYHRTQLELRTIDIHKSSKEEAWLFGEMARLRLSSFQELAEDFFREIDSHASQSC